MTRKVEPRRPGGFNEYLPEQQIAYNKLRDIIRHTYEAHGFSPVETPDIELTDVLLAKGGGETEQEVYTFTREGSKTSLTLRYDLTVPLARYVAEHESHLVFPFRRYQMGRVHRAERQQRGRYREFEQNDIDIIGSYSPVVDAELPVIINDIFQKFNFGEFTIRINNRKILVGFFESIGVDAVGADVLRVVDKIEKISSEEFSQQLASLGLSARQIESVVDITSVKGDNKTILTWLKRIPNQSKTLIQGIEELEAVLEAVGHMGVPDKRVQVDPRIARGLDYYTGTVYETTLDDYPSLGSVCSGGRYDNLAGHYTKTDMPGVGISIGLSRLFSQLLEIEGLVSLDQKSPSNVVVMPLGREQWSEAFKSAGLLREAGYSVLVYAEDDSMKKKLRYALRMGFRYMILIGENEAKSSSVMLKDLENREERLVLIDEIAGAISMP